MSNEGGGQAAPESLHPAIYSLTYILLQNGFTFKFLS